MGRILSRIAAATLAIALASGLAAAQDTRPTALLLDGLFIYVQQNYIGVSVLAAGVERMGYRTLVDNHLMSRTGGVEPDVIVGHSMGGSTALRYAAERIAAGKPAPVVITIDAAFGSPPCPATRCINIHSPGFPRVEGAENIDAWQSGAFMVNHAMLATNEAVQRMVLERLAELLAARRVHTPPLAAPVPVPRPH